MAFYLRKVRYQRWVEENEADWLEAGGIPADPLGDLETSNNALSVYWIDSDRSNLERVVAALAANSKYPHKPFDYLLFDASLTASLGIQVLQSDGDTRDQKVNADWHYDLVKLSVSKITELLRSLWKEEELDRKYKGEILSLVRQSVSSGYINRRGLDEKWREQLGIKFER